MWLNLNTLAASIKCAEFVIVVGTEVVPLFFVSVDFYFFTTVETPMDCSFEG